MARCPRAMEPSTQVAGQLVQIVFRMVLQAPKYSALMGDRHRLDVRIAVRCEQQATGRQMRDLVVVADERVEDGLLAGIEGVCAPLRGQGNLAGNAHLA